ncbi:CD1247 N-terminal domain-containing protein [Miniphocaeibacter massiliensis]|uniref:CD1247 N-terminal domain-containing protein n=1 Tax=Miniphocaeibacter massiliensis TaxID=2041841 RepID=UPI000C08CA8A|nr:CD1247 N-terminal domain-containing protein [Miniphocaeibacter massiliensis]
MDNIFENIAYLKGLAEGLEIEEDTKVGKLMMGIIDALDQMAGEIEDLSYGLEDVEEYLTFVDDDLSEVEDYIFDFDDEDYEDCEYYDEFDEDYDDEDEEVVEE